MDSSAAASDFSANVYRQTLDWSSRCSAIKSFTRSSAWGGISRRIIRRSARVEIVPIHDRIEAERIGALRLPAPERADREHNDVSLAEALIDGGGAAR